VLKKALFLYKGVDKYIQKERKSAKVDGNHRIRGYGVDQRNSSETRKSI